ncbi:MAG TPA: thioredoxin domain-containing protein [Pyrinomonadaceae bacterium]|nr:thioredoxin domain-containing protein [Pyrinomonadaceae bacterium]
MRRSLPFAIIMLALLAALASGFYFSRPVRNTDAAVAAPSHNVVPPALPTTGAEPAHIKGPEKTEVTLEEFADFECPACGGFYPILKAIEKDYGSRVRVIFREFPLSQHVHAMPAARAAEAAGLQGKFWEMHDLLYEQRDNWTKAPDVQVVFEQYARRLGLDVDRFKKDQTSEVVQKRITLDHVRGRHMKLHSTPTVFLNDVEIPFAEMKTTEALRKTIEQALATKAQS